jgi:hypothetical protein
MTKLLVDGVAERNAAIEFKLDALTKRVERLESRR